MSLCILIDVFCFSQIFHDQAEPHKEHSYHMWNYPPGTLYVHTSFSNQLHNFPFYHEFLGTKPGNQFTAIVLAVSPARQKSGRFFKLIETINRSEHVDQVSEFKALSSGWKVPLLAFRFWHATNGVFLMQNIIIYFLPIFATIWASLVTL